MTGTVEIRPVGKINARVRVPGSKSYTQRAIIVASLAQGVSRLSNFLISEDTSFLIQSLSDLGAAIVNVDSNAGNGGLVIQGTAGRIRPCPAPIYLGNNGTAMRFLMTLVALGEGSYRLIGGPRLCERPIGTLLDALRSVGVEIRSERKDGCPPVVVEAGGLAGGEVRFKDIESSQFVSSLLIAAPYARRDTEILLEGRTVSAPYIEMTADVMRRFGAEVESLDGRRYRVRNEKKYCGRDYPVEGDVSSASYFFLAAALCGGKVSVENLNPDTKQGDIGVLKILEDFGCTVAKGGDRIEVAGGTMPSGDISIDMGDIPDMVPTVAVLAAFRGGWTRIANAAHLRIKESNRIEAMATELRKIGAVAEETPDGLIIGGGGDLHGAVIDTYNDHRIAMSFAVAGLALAGMKIRNGECVGKSFPGFWDEMDRLTKS